VILHSAAKIRKQRQESFEGMLSDLEIPSPSTKQQPFPDEDGKK
jgi:hypothetical protein